MTRHIFRMTYYQNVGQFLADGAICAKNHQPIQPCFRTSYQDIVNRRGQPQFATPCGRVVNDFVPFYFSPITSMAYTIHCGNVQLREPTSALPLGPATLDDLVYFVCDPAKIAGAGLAFWFTDIACNSGLAANFCNDLRRLPLHVDWSVFDETPKIAAIPEIGYAGVCRYFFNRDEPERYRQRTQKRMAEFMVLDAVPMALVDCILVQNPTIKAAVDTYVANSIWNIPVYVKPGCYF